MNPAILIDRYVPEGSLRSIARQSQIKHSGKTKQQLIKDINDRLGEEQTWGILDDYFEVAPVAMT